VLMPRFVAVSICGLALATSAFAQTSPDSSASRGTPQGVKQEHPEWFAERKPYRPCPASVALSNGRAACLGCPTKCQWHF
jgi:hypothetical protein